MNEILIILFLLILLIIKLTGSNKWIHEIDRIQRIIFRSQKILYLLTSLIILLSGNAYYKREMNNQSTELSNMNKINKIKRKVTATEKKIVAARQKWICNNCGQILDATYEIDHIRALWKGGSNDINNLQALCRNCHGNKTMMDRVYQ
jgi:5-methylcytosine-specific restriction endonuclease McrA